MSRSSRMRRVIQETAEDPVLRVVERDLEETRDDVAETVGEVVPVGWDQVDTESDALLVDLPPLPPETEEGDRGDAPPLSVVPRPAPTVPSLAQLVEMTEAAHQEDEDVLATLPHGQRPPRSPDPVPRMDVSRLEMRIRREGRWLLLNPKRPGTLAHANFDLYVDGMTVSAFLASHDRRRARTDLSWDIEHGFVRLETQEEWLASQKSDEERLS